MTVAEWIKLWDSINISTIPIVYYYKNKKELKHKLYTNNNKITSIKLCCTQEPLTEYDILISHKYINEEDYSYDQQAFINNLYLNIPEDASTYKIIIYIE